MLIAIAAFTYGRNAARQSFDRLLLGAASQIARSISLQGTEVSVDLPVTAFELLALATEDRVIYAVHDAEGHLVTGYPQLRPPAEERRFYAGVFAGEPIRIVRVTRPLTEPGYIGSIEVLVGQTLHARTELATQITRNALIAAALVAIVMAALAVLAVRSALAPINRIETALKSRTPKDLTPVDIAVPVEVANLVETLNIFMSRLDRQFDIMRNLIADASHQLRTPIAALRAQAELAEDEDEPEALRAIAARIRARSVKLGNLTDQLLNHALIIHRAESVPLERLDLRVVAISAAEEIDHAIFGSRSQPGLDLPEDGVWCDGDRLSLVEAIKNLASNALRHGTEPVILSVSSEAGRARIAVQDSGAGIPQEYWADAATRYARSSGVSAESAGLGLAIAHAVAVAHGGALEFRRAKPSGFEAAIVMPLVAGGSR